MGLGFQCGSIFARPVREWTGFSPYFKQPPKKAAGVPRSSSAAADDKLCTLFPARGSRIKGSMTGHLPE